jgi:hypothetical protein
LSQDQFLDLMQSDKKTLNGQINLILQKGIGHAFITNEYPHSILLETISQKFFEMNLKPYAANHLNSIGRLFKENAIVPQK